MNGFALLWGKILDSSLWVKESKETRLVWITILAMKNKNGEVYASEVGLADRAKVTVEECREALRVFLSPDPDDTSGVEDGRRIRRIPGGWQVINNDQYRFSTEAKREMWRLEKEEQRKRQAAEVARRNRGTPLPKRGKPLKGEIAAVKAYESGNTALAEEIAAMGIVGAGNGIPESGQTNGDESDFRKLKKFFDGEGGGDLTMSHDELKEFDARFGKKSESK